MITIIQTKTILTMKSLLLFLLLFPAISFSQLITTYQTFNLEQNQKYEWYVSDTKFETNIWVITKSHVTWVTKDAQYDIIEIKQTESGVIYKCEGSNRTPIIFKHIPNKRIVAVWYDEYNNPRSLSMEIAD